MAVGSCVACGSEGASSSCPRCSNAVYCGPRCLEAHGLVHKEVCGLAARGGPAAAPAAPSAASGPQGPLRFSAKDIADAARSVLRESSGTAAPKGSSAAEQARILHELAASASAKGEASTATPIAKGTTLQLATGLRDLQAANSQAEAEEAWTAQAAAGEAAKLPRLHALFACEVDSEESYSHLVSCIQSICKQWRAPPEQSLVSWHAESEELRTKVRGLMKEFTQAVEGGGARIAYADGPARAVRCRVASAEQTSRLALGEHVRRLLDSVPEAENSWVILCDSDSLWHPGRTAFFRNFTRQVPGPDKCTAAVAPLLARPAADADAGAAFASPLEVNKRLQQGSSAVVVKEELADVSQCCIRRSLLAAFFEAHGDAVLAHELCFTRLLSFVARDHGSTCLQVAPEQFRAPDKNQAPTWMIFCRRPGPLPLAPARASSADAERASSAPDAARQALRAEEDLTGVVAALRREVEYHVLRQWGNKEAAEIASLAMESVEFSGEAYSEVRESWLIPLAEELAIEASKAFGVGS